jgi:hypothetical protein
LAKMSEVVVGTAAALQPPHVFCTTHATQTVGEPHECTGIALVKKLGGCTACFVQHPMLHCVTDFLCSNSYPQHPPPPTLMTNSPPPLPPCSSSRGPRRPPSPSYPAAPCKYERDIPPSPHSFPAKTNPYSKHPSPQPLPSQLPIPHLLPTVDTPSPHLQHAIILAIQL